MKMKMENPYTPMTEKIPLGHVSADAYTDTTHWSTNCSSLVPVTYSLELGEGPHWDADRQKLYFVDMTAGEVHSYEPATKAHYKAKIGEKDVTLILPIEGEPNKFVIGHDGDLDIITWDGQSDRISKIEKYVELEPEVDVRLNDGKTSPSGVIVVGSMAKKLANKTVPAGRGNVFVIDCRQKSTVLPRKWLKSIDLSNGLCWNPEETVFYWADTLRRKVYKYDYSRENLTINNERVLVDYAKENLKGYPDGMTLDRMGTLFIASVDGGGEVIRVDSNTGKILDHIEFPNVSDVSSVAFGGRNLEDLYVTTIRREGEPLSGRLFVLKGLGTRGFAGVPARL